jgi:hypothetical protein
LAVIRYAKLHGTKHRPWLTALLARKPTKVAAIALTNKIGSVPWGNQAVRRALLEKFPSWDSAITESARAGMPITIQPDNWSGPLLTITARSDTVTIAPLCNFGLDYVFTSNPE